MNSRSMYPAGLGVCLALLALSAVGQTTTGSSSHNAMAPSKTATANTTTNAATGTTTASTERHQGHQEAPLDRSSSDARQARIDGGGVSGWRSRIGLSRRAQELCCRASRTKGTLSG